MCVTKPIWSHVLALSTWTLNKALIISFRAGNEADSSPTEVKSSHVINVFRRQGCPHHSRGMDLLSLHAIEF